MTVVTKQVKPEAPKTPKPIKCEYTLPAYTLYEVLKAVNGIVSYGLDTKEAADVTFNVTKKGIVVRQMDKARHAMIDFLLAKQGLNQYIVKNEGSVTFDIKRLLKILNGVKKQTINDDGTIKTEGEILTMIVDEPKLTLDLTHSEFSNSFRLTALAPEEGELPPTPKLTHTAVAKVQTKQLKTILDRATRAGNVEYVRIEASNEGVNFQAKNDEDGSEYEADLKKEQLASLEVKEQTLSAYNIGFLINILKNLPKDAEIITLSFSSDMPINIDTGVYDKLSFFLAPRIIAD